MSFIQTSVSMINSSVVFPILETLTSRNCTFKGQIFGFYKSFLCSASLNLFDTMVWLINVIISVAMFVFIISALFRVWSFAFNIVWNIFSFLGVWSIKSGNESEETTVETTYTRIRKERLETTGKLLEHLEEQIKDLKEDIQTFLSEAEKTDNLEVLKSLLKGLKEKYPEPNPNLDPIWGDLGDLKDEEKDNRKKED